MATPSRSAPAHIVLVGAGHAHVFVLEAFGRRPDPTVRLTLVTPGERTPYSGMLPGYLAGQYALSDMTIDAAGLARFAGAELRLARASAVLADEGVLVLEGGERIAYDLLSLDVGSQPAKGHGGGHGGGQGGDGKGIAVKPVERFAETVDRIVRDAPRAGERPFSLAVVGAGVAGTELAFAFRRRLHDEGVPHRIVLVGGGREVVPERSSRTRGRIRSALARHGIETVLGARVASADGAGLVLENGRRVAADAVVWATTSSAPAWLQDGGGLQDGVGSQDGVGPRDGGLRLENGYVAVDETLRSVSHRNVFAAGDIAALPNPRPKAGVFAVRQGPVLAENLRRAARGDALVPFRPQDAWLALISTADGRAVADKWNLSVEGRWVARWKEWNDRRFVDRFNALAAEA